MPRVTTFMGLLKAPLYGSHHEPASIAGRFGKVFGVDIRSATASLVGRNGGVPGPNIECAKTGGVLHVTCKVTSDTNGRDTAIDSVNKAVQ